MGKRLGYLERTVLAHEYIGRERLRGKWLDVSIQHSAWCGMLNGGAVCGCGPDIVMTCEDAVWDVDLKGRVSRRPPSDGGAAVEVVK
jgi:hypothetical protein